LESAAARKDVSVHKAIESARALMQPSSEMMDRVRDAFLGHGFRALSMGELAEACGYTRRNLYNYFSNKEDAFRALIAFTNTEQRRLAIEAGRRLFDRNANALEVITEVLVVRYAPVRKRLNGSAHAGEINNEAFRLCHDIMIQSAGAFTNALKGVIVDLQKAGRLQLDAGISPAQLAQLLGDGVRGINQSLPPVSPDSLPVRYRLMCQAILYGGAERSAAAAQFKAIRRAK
jgi:AcrR family transcriptional regulator